jgi:hypothetical protein
MLFPLKENKKWLLTLSTNKKLTEGNILVTGQWTFGVTDPLLLTFGVTDPLILTLGSLTRPPPTDIGVTDPLMLKFRVTDPPHADFWVTDPPPPPTDIWFH